MNRKFILIGLLLVACFAFTVLQAATGEAQQCDASLACDPTTGTCCNQCDPGPACVAGDPHAIPCCALDENDMSRGDHPNDPNMPPSDCGPSPEPRHAGKRIEHMVKKAEKMNAQIHGLRERLNACTDERAVCEQALNQPVPPATPEPSASQTRISQSLEALCDWIGPLQHEAQAEQALPPGVTYTFSTGSGQTRTRPVLIDDFSGWMGVRGYCDQACISGSSTCNRGPNRENMGQ